MLRNPVLYARIDAASERAQEQCPNGDLLPVLAVVWLGSVARVAAAVARRETFGSEATLALSTAVGIFFTFIQGGWWLIQRARLSSVALPPPSDRSTFVTVEGFAPDGRWADSSVQDERPQSGSSANVISLTPRLAARRSSSGLPEA